jgi:hypothetical protein
MDAKAERKVIADTLTELQRDMMATVEDWDETELGWYLVHRGEMFSTPKSDRLRRKAYDNALRTSRL